MDLLSQARQIMNPATQSFNQIINNAAQLLQARAKTMNDPVTNYAKMLLTNLDPANTQTPILGAMRQFNQQTFGQQPYANPNLPLDQRLANAIDLYGQNFMTHDTSATQFGRTLESYKNKGLSNNMLRELTPEEQAIKNAQFVQELRNKSMQSDFQTQPKSGLDLVPNQDKPNQLVPNVQQAGLSDVAKTSKNFDEFVKQADKEASKIPFGEQGTGIAREVGDLRMRSQSEKQYLGKLKDIFNQSRVAEQPLSGVKGNK